MYHFSLEVAAGKIGFEWSSDFRLSRIRCRWWAGPADVEPSGVASGAIELRREGVPFFWQPSMESFERYFDSGEPFGEVPWDALDQSDWTPFQQSVYRAIVNIPHGETRPYAWVSERIQKMTAHRAVGQALRRNPIPILIPCHRVVAATGGVGGFMGESDPDGPELQLKRRLLSLEETYRNPLFPFLRLPVEPRGVLIPMPAKVAHCG